MNINSTNNFHLKPIILSTFLLLLSFESFTQSKFFENLNKEVKVGLYSSSSKKTPYLNKLNQYGLVPTDANTLYFNGAIWKNYDSTKTANGKIKSWGYSYGLESQFNTFSDIKLLLPVVHISARFKGWEMYLGRKREFFGLADTSGVFRSYIWSGNALPIPKLQIATPNYIPLISRGLVSGKFGYAHGWFGNENFTDNYYLHQKWMYLKIGREDKRFSFTGGLNHFGQWGGYSEYLKDDYLATKNGHFASDPFVYLNMALPLGIWKFPSGKYTYWETQNRFGNHLGSIDLGVDVRTKIGDFSIYRQTPWEDGQAPEVFLSEDGNYSLIFKPSNQKNIQKIGLELVNTQRQGDEITTFARFLGWSEKHPNEIQNYFNHGQYRDGWSYNGSGIGTGAIVSNIDRRNIVENYKRFTIDNNVLAIGVSISGIYYSGTYVVRVGIINSSGVGKGDKNNPIHQFSTQLTYTRPLSKFNFDSKIDLGIDRGKLYGNQVGLNITLIKRWN
jgi:hypothetical protein